MYGGLALLLLQWGVFFRLTFFELSWDVIEPVTYFVTSAFGIGAYAYFLWFHEVWPCLIDFVEMPCL